MGVIILFGYGIRMVKRTHGRYYILFYLWGNRVSSYFVHLWTFEGCLTNFWSLIILETTGDNMNQTVKTVEDGHEFFFFDHSFKTAYEHAMDNVKRNSHKDIDVYFLNTRPYLFLKKDGSTDKWLFHKSFKKVNT